MKNASTPGERSSIIVFRVWRGPEKKSLANIVDQLSMIRLKVQSVTAMTGLSRNIVDAGLLKPIFLFWKSTCVKPHRRPPKALALSTNRNPPRTKCVSVATIRRTPLKMSAITPTSRQEKRSRWKRKAKRRTNIRDDDFTIALKTRQEGIFSVEPDEHTIEG